MRSEVVEQLLKYIPTKEEIETLNQYSEEVHRMTKADKFFYEVAQIPRYEEKLKVSVSMMSKSMLTNYILTNRRFTTRRHLSSGCKWLRKGFIVSQIIFPTGTS